VWLSFLSFSKEVDMKRLCLFIFVICVLTSELSYAQISIGSGTTVLFATVDEAKEVLTRRDDFVGCMSPFDRAARMKTDADISENQYLEFVGNNVLAWGDAEKQKVISALQGIQPRLKVLSLPFPKKVFMAKTTGNEEGGAAYTRANTIVFPKDDLTAPISKIQKVICHELFHILSRANPELREKCYAAIGFVKCDEIEFPVTLKSRKITNPDAPRNDHCIRLKVDGNATWAIPILFSNVEKYDRIRGGEFFSYLQFRFLLVERYGNSPTVKPVYESQRPKLAAMEQISGFIEQVGGNTEYIIHPEEILADNFALLVLSERKVSSPEIIRKLEKILKEKQVAEPSAPADANKPRR
jgi:hypothetical protein